MPVIEHTQSYAIGKPFCTGIRDRDGWMEGEFVFEHGVVRIYAEPGRKLVSLAFYYNGRGWYRTITGKNYTDIGLARIAGKFGREVISHSPK